jgi:hypothetical protein
MIPEPWRIAQIVAGPYGRQDRPDQPGRARRSAGVVAEVP